MIQLFQNGSFKVRTIEVFPKSPLSLDDILLHNYSMITILCAWQQVTEAVVQQADVIRQRKEILSTLVDDITSQLKYEYAILNDLAPGQRSVWMALDTQADTMRECCEKIAYLVRQV